MPGAHVLPWAQHRCEPSRSLLLLRPALSCPVCSDKPVIKKALVEMGGAPMASYTSMRAIWAIQDWCRSPGPIQVPQLPGWAAPMLPLQAA